MLSNYIKQMFIGFIKFYQKTLSFDHGVLKIFFPYGYCRFRPTCSEYAVQSIEKYGVLKGGLKAAWRILRCNPWNKGGYDPVKK
jgi:hypothetical protein